jgi:prepilin-type processing-associated H-X9-DG protein
MGGVLLALPALMAVGLLAHAEKYFQLPRGFYRMETIFLLLAFMALARLKTVEDLRYYAPGEWGKLLGSDRIPEAKTLREKIGILAQEGEPCAWAGELCREWMAMEPDSAGILYVDGHVRVYNGKQTELPRHYVSRQKLCQRATVDYWVNAMDGQPFFMVNKAVDPGLLQVLEDEIVPRLEREVPNQPKQLALDENPYLQRLTLAFDREGYSPAFMKRMREKRIACLSYNKFPGDDWPEEEFQPHAVKLQAGNVIEMKLAERGVFLGKELWVREIRKMTESGHQTSILSTDYTNDCGPVSAAMFARWSQENFFGYMRQHYNLDRLADYSTEEISDTTKVVNPQYRELDGEVRKSLGKLNRKRKEFGALMLNDTIEPDRVEAYQQKKAELQEEIAVLEKTVEEQKACRKQTPRHVTMGDLPKEERFRRLGTVGKYFIDTIKMIAYRAETAMAGIVREKMSRHDDARSLLRAIYATEADIVPDEAAGTLTVRLHQLANRSSGVTAQHLCDELNATMTRFPGNNMRLIYELVS